MSCLFICPYFDYNTINMSDSLTAFPMILLSLCASIYVFNGAFFRYKTHLTLFISTFILIFSVYISIINKNIIVSATQLFTIITSSSFLPLVLVILTSIMLVTIIMKWIKTIAVYVIIIISSYLITIIVNDIMILGNIIVLITLFIIGNILIFTLYKIKKDELFILCSSLFGAISLSTLFSSFYYFPPSVHILLFVVLFVGGFFTQRHTLIVKRKKESAND